MPKLSITSALWTLSLTFAFLLLLPYTNSDLSSQLPHTNFSKHRKQPFQSNIYSKFTKPHSLSNQFYDRPLTISTLDRTPDIALTPQFSNAPESSTYLEENSSMDPPMLLDITALTITHINDLPFNTGMLPLRSGLSYIRLTWPSLAQSSIEIGTIYIDAKINPISISDPFLPDSSHLDIPLATFSTKNDKSITIMTPHVSEMPFHNFTLVVDAGYNVLTKAQIRYSLSITIIRNCYTSWNAFTGVNCNRNGTCDYVDDVCICNDGFYGPKCDKILEQSCDTSSVNCSNGIWDNYHNRGCTFCTCNGGWKTQAPNPPAPLLTTMPSIDISNNHNVLDLSNTLDNYDKNAFLENGEKNQHTFNIPPIFTLFQPLALIEQCQYCPLVCETDQVINVDCTECLCINGPFVGSGCFRSYISIFFDLYSIPYPFSTSSAAFDTRNIVQLLLLWIKAEINPLFTSFLLQVERVGLLQFRILAVQDESGSEDYLTSFLQRIYSIQQNDYNHLATNIPASIPTNFYPPFSHNYCNLGPNFCSTKIGVGGLTHISKVYQHSNFQWHCLNPQDNTYAQCGPVLTYPEQWTICSENLPWQQRHQTVCWDVSLNEQTTLPLCNDNSVGYQSIQTINCDCTSIYTLQECNTKIATQNPPSPIWLPPIFVFSSLSVTNDQNQPVTHFWPGMRLHFKWTGNTSYLQRFKDMKLDLFATFFGQPGNQNSFRMSIRLVSTLFYNHQITIILPQLDTIGFGVMILAYQQITAIPFSLIDFYFHADISLPIPTNADEFNPNSDYFSGNISNRLDESFPTFPGRQIETPVYFSPTPPCYNACGTNQKCDATDGLCHCTPDSQFGWVRQPPGTYPLSTDFVARPPISNAIDPNFLPIFKEFNGNVYKSEQCVQGCAKKKIFTCVDPKSICLSDNILTADNIICKCQSNGFSGTFCDVYAECPLQPIDCPHGTAYNYTIMQSVESGYIFDSNGDGTSQTDEKMDEHGHKRFSPFFAQDIPTAAEAGCYSQCKCDVGYLFDIYTSSCQCSRSEMCLSEGTDLALYSASPCNSPCPCLPGFYGDRCNLAEYFMVFKLEKPQSVPGTEILRFQVYISEINTALPKYSLPFELSLSHAAYEYSRVELISRTNPVPIFIDSFVVRVARIPSVNEVLSLRNVSSRSSYLMITLESRLLQLLETLFFLETPDAGINVSNIQNDYPFDSTTLHYTVKKQQELVEDDLLHPYLFDNTIPLTSPLAILQRSGLSHKPPKYPNYNKITVLSSTSHVTPQSITPQSITPEQRFGNYVLKPTDFQDSNRYIDQNYIALTPSITLRGLYRQTLKSRTSGLIDFACNIVNSQCPSAPLSDYEYIAPPDPRQIQIVDEPAMPTSVPEPPQEYVIPRRFFGLITLPILFIIIPLFIIMWCLLCAKDKKRRRRRWRNILCHKRAASVVLESKKEDPTVVELQPIPPDIITEFKNEQGDDYSNQDEDEDDHESHLDENEEHDYYPSSLNSTTPMQHTLIHKQNALQIKHDQMRLISESSQNFYNNGGRNPLEDSDTEDDQSHDGSNSEQSQINKFRQKQKGTAHNLDLDSYYFGGTSRIINHSTTSTFQQTHQEQEHQQNPHGRDISLSPSSMGAHNQNRCNNTDSLEQSNSIPIHHSKTHRQKTQNTSHYEDAVDPFSSRFPPNKSHFQPEFSLSSSLGLFPKKNNRELSLSTSSIFFAPIPHNISGNLSNLNNETLPHQSDQYINDLSHQSQNNNQLIADPQPQLQNKEDSNLEKAQEITVYHQEHLESFLYHYSAHLNEILLTPGALPMITLEQLHTTVVQFMASEFFEKLHPTEQFAYTQQLLILCQKHMAVCQPT